MIFKHWVNFEQWKQRVNVLVYARLGVECDDLTDYPYHEAWLAGKSPSDVAYEVVNRDRIYA